MPIITPVNIKEELIRFADLGNTINKRNAQNLASLKKALESLDKFSSLSSELNNFLYPRLENTKKEKKAGQYAEYCSRYEAIKAAVSTKGLRAVITKGIKTLEDAEQNKQDRLEKDRKEDGIAREVIKKLLPQLTEKVNEYSKARFEDKDAILEEFKELRASLTKQIDLVHDTEAKRTFIQQRDALSKQVNERSIVLAKEEAELKAIIVETAKEVAEKVEAMTINQQIFVIASKPVQEAIQRLMSGFKASDLQKLLTATNETSLIHSVQTAIVAASGKESQISKQLTRITALSKEQQLDVYLSLLTGNDVKGTLATLGLEQSTQLAVTATLLNQLAIQALDIAKIDQKDQLAIRDFATNFVSNMARIESGEATYLSVFAQIKIDGKDNLAQFHIPLHLLGEKTVNIAAIMATQLLKLGVNADSTVLTAFTNSQQVGAFLLLKDRDLSTLALEGKGLSGLIEVILQDTSALKQITNGELDVSDKALKAAFEHNSNAIVVSNAYLKKLSAEQPAAVSVSDVIKNLAILKEVFRLTVIDPVSQKKLGITKFIGNTPKLSLTAPGVEEPKKEIEFVSSPLPVQPIVDETNEVPFCGPTDNCRPINKKLVEDFNTALDKLKALQISLEKRYANNTKKQYIVTANARLIMSLADTLTQYQKDGDLLAFKNASLGAINNEVKNEYNTHRDNFVTQFFAAIVHAFKNLWNVLYGSVESKQTRAGIVSFFNSTSRPTNSALVLCEFNSDLTKAFSLIDVPVNEDLEHELSGLASVKC